VLVRSRSENKLRERLAARIRQEKFMELRIGPSIRVSDEEAAEWFATNRDSISTPERIEARHIFIPTLTHPPEEARQTLAKALEALEKKQKDFATLAREISLDPATKELGGALGWMSRDRLPADFAAPAFSMELNAPGLVRTKLGWHLVEITAHRKAEARAYEEVKPEIVAALEAIKRRQAVAKFRTSLRLSEAGKIEIFPESLPSET
jgi:parvulin-like peptidyl-prolyl isomerase